MPLEPGTRLGRDDGLFNAAACPATASSVDVVREGRRDRHFSTASLALDVDPESENAMYAALARARELGLVLPPYVVLWVDAPCAEILAQTVVQPSLAHVRIFLRNDLGPRCTYETTLHELQHVADAPRFDELSPAERERRAEAFAASASRGHRFPERAARRHRPTERSLTMSCTYERYLQMAGVSGMMTEKRKAEFRALHQHNSSCRSDGRAPDGAHYESDWWRRERFKLHREAAERDAATRNGHGRA